MPGKRSSWRRQTSRADAMCPPYIAITWNQVQKTVPYWFFQPQCHTGTVAGLVGCKTGRRGIWAIFSIPYQAVNHFPGLCRCISGSYRLGATVLVFVRQGACERSEKMPSTAACWRVSIDCRSTERTSECSIP